MIKVGKIDPRTITIIQDVGRSPRILKTVENHVVCERAAGSLTSKYDLRIHCKPIDFEGIIPSGWTYLDVIRHHGEFYTVYYILVEDVYPKIQAARAKKFSNTILEKLEDLFYEEGSDEIRELLLHSRTVLEKYYKDRN